MKTPLLEPHFNQVTGLIKNSIKISGHIYFILQQHNRLNLNANAECGHYSLCIFLKWE